MAIKFPEYQYLGNGTVTFWFAPEDMDPKYQRWERCNIGDFIWEQVLGFCGCGPGGGLEYVLEGLRHINEKSPDIPIGECHGEKWSKWCDEHWKRGDNVLGSPSARYFFYWWAAKEGLTEHGGSVPGWLDGDGRKLLELLEVWEKWEEESDGDTRPETTV